MRHLSRPDLSASVHTVLNKPGIIPWLCAAGALALSVVGMGIPSYWTDEAATISAVSRTPAELWKMLHTVDAVHALYYTGMLPWSRWFGISEVAMRMPSAVAVAGSVGILTAYLQRRLGNGAAISAALLLTVMPRVSWSAVEARSYSWAMFLSLVATLVFVVWLRRRTRLRPRAQLLLLGVYGLASALSLCLSVLTGTLLVVHLIMAVVWHRDAISRALLVQSCAALAAAPVLIAALTQKDQVSWISTDPQEIGSLVWKDQYFTSPFHLAAPLMWLFGGLAVTAIFLARDRRLALGATLWVLLPTVLITVLTAAGLPLYAPRYLIFTAPAAVVLMVLGIRCAPRWWIRVPLILLVTGLCVPGAVAARLPDAKDTAYRPIAEMVGRADVVLYPEPEARGVSIAYPARTAHAHDLFLKASPAASGTLWGLDVDDEEEARLAREVHGMVASIGRSRDRHQDQIRVETELSGHCQKRDKLPGYRWTATLWECH